MESPATPGKLLTAEQFFALPNDGVPWELDRGRIITLQPVPPPEHSYHSGLIFDWVGEFANEHDEGRIFNDNCRVVTERNPDTVRAPDITYYSYKRLPKGRLPEGNLAIVPDAAFEVRFVNDFWPRRIQRINEMFKVGVLVVAVLDPLSDSMMICRKNMPPRVLFEGDVLTLPEVLPGFELPIARFFE